MIKEEEEQKLKEKEKDKVPSEIDSTSVNAIPSINVHTKASESEVQQISTEEEHASTHNNLEV